MHDKGQHVFGVLQSIPSSIRQLGDGEFFYHRACRLRPDKAGSLRDLWLYVSKAMPAGSTLKCVPREHVEQSISY